MKVKLIKEIFLLIIIFITTLFFGGSTRLQLLEENNNFYISNNSSYAPGDIVKLNLYTYAEISEKFQLKLLKINDPVTFFSLLDQNYSHYSFDIWGKDNVLLLKYTSLIKQWEIKPDKKAQYGYNEINVGKIEKPGIYIVQAIREDKVGYCAIVVTNLSMVYKNNQKEILAYIADAKTGQFNKSAKFDFLQNGKLIGSRRADKDGVMYVKLTDFESADNSIIQLFGYADDEILLSDPYFYFNQGQNEYLTAYIYTQQPVYRPAQEINFKAIFRNKAGNEYQNIPEQKFSITVKSSKDKEVYSGEATTNEFGTLSGSFFLDEDADLGYYSIILKKDEQAYYGSFSVEEYKKPEFKVNVVTDRKQYSRGDKLTATVTADYYFGSPVKNADVQVSIYKQYFWRPWWYWSEWSWFYGGFKSDRYISSQKELIFQESGTLNEDGKYELSYKIGSDNSDNSGDYQYSIVAQVTDASRRAINGFTEAFVTRGSFTISTSPEKWFFKQGSEVKLKVNTSDFSDKPVQTDFRVIVYYPGDSRYVNKTSYTDTIWAKTNVAGSAVVKFFPKRDVTGYFSYTIIAFDEKEREIETSSSFYVGDVDNYYYQRTNAGLEIITDKEAYEKGDSLIAYVFIPDPDQELLLSYETDKILSYKKLKPVKNSFEIREELTEKFSPSFNISISFIKDRMLYQTTKLIGVLAKDKFLNIALTPSKDIYKPGEQADYEISVKDYLGNPVNNTEISFGIIDESIYAIKEDDTQPIETFFYSPQRYFISTNNSLQYGYFSTYSRTATYIDKNYFSYKKDDKTYKGRLYGKIIIPGQEKIPDGLFVMLTGEKYYYSAKVDSLGYYEIKNIAKGNYQLFVSAGYGGMLLIDDVKIDVEKKYDITFTEEQDQQIERMRSQGITSGQSRNETADELSIESSKDEKMPSSLILKQKETNDKSSYLQADIRTNFVDALIWKAHVVTDNNGKAKVQFKIPDNLTTWRTTVRGITKQTDVGQSTNKFISRKDLLIRMETPRFFRQGDEVVISTIVHNYLTSKKKTKIEFNSDKLKLLGSRINESGREAEKFSVKKVYEVEIAANSELRIDWKVKVDFPTGEATLKASALTNEESDAMEVKVPVLPNGVKVIEPIVKNYTNDNVNETFDFDLPNNFDLRSATLSFSVAPSIAGTILKSLDDLAGYPYGCVEQTMSRFLPTIIVSNTFNEIKVPLKSKTIEELPKFVEAGLKRLYEHQHSDGGWGWWKNDNSNPYMTAYVIYGMGLAKEAGYNINENVYQSGLNNLKNQIINAKADIDETTLSYMIYALSTALKNQQYDKGNYLEIINILLRKDLQSYPLSLLAISLKNMNETSKAKELAAEILKQVNEEKSFAFWSGKGWHYNWQNDNVQGTAFAVKAILNIEGNSELIEKAVKWLIQKKQGYSWRSTQETAVVLFALTDYLKITKELDPDYTAKVFVNDKEVYSAKFDKDDVFNEGKTIKISDDKEKILRKGRNRIRIEKSGKGALYFSGFNEYFTTELASVKNDNGFKIRREYYILETGSKDGHIIYYKKDFDGIVKSGQDIFVKTFVESKSDNLDYFILEDMIPSGFEVVKEMDRYFIDGENNYNTYSDYLYDYMPWRWHFAEREYRDEKVAFFVTKSQKGMEFSYIIKAQIPGEYKIMPAQGYLMYYPELNGFSDVVDIVVEDI
ncbi:MAG: alpha-2-macroglobulin family protein [Ignavibacterium sp.]|nr:alpha-2-macroglobulin family protein [Ignavibacterium sp.]